MKILIVEDDQSLADIIKARLEFYFNVDIALSGSKAQNLITQTSYDLILVDLVLPDIDGIDLCKYIRKLDINSPILVLTGQLDVNSKLSSFESGVDDYLTKPFNFLELLARIRALLRRTNSGIPAEKLYIRTLCLDIQNKTINDGRTSLLLRKKEFELLTYLIEHKGKVIPRDSIFNALWFSDLYPTSNALEVHIFRIRKKLIKTFGYSPVQTVRGFGYKIDA